MSSNASAVTVVDNQDLQTYLDSFNKEIDEGNGSLVTLTPEAVEALAGADAVAQRILRNEDGCEVGEEGVEGDEEGTYFVDEAGNYYFQPSSSSKDALTVSSDAHEELDAPAANSQKRTATSKTRQSTRKSGRKRTAAAQVESSEVEENKLDYFYVMGNKKVAISLNDEDEANSELNEQQHEEEEVDDPDDPEADSSVNKQIYDFEESIGGTLDGDDNRNASSSDTEILVTKRLVRIKNGAGSTPAKSSNAKDANGAAGVVHRCSHCDYTTQKRFLLSRHMKAHSDERPFKCSVCERGFKTNASLLNHVNAHLGNKPHSCKFCESAFTTSGELVRHVRYRHTREKPHKCTECDYSSVELSKLRRHIRCHTGERPYQCPHCTYASPDTFKLKRHMRTHTGEKPYACDICQARFTQSNSLKAHRLIHSVGDKPVFQCTLCPTTCGRKTDLRLHIQKLHHSDKPITCRRCGKDLPDRYSYKMHVKTHEGEKCYRCQFCPYASISMRHLEAHKLIHTDMKPFVCEYCKLSFRQNQLLKRHINLYHVADYKPPKPRAKLHSCPDCKRSFTHKGNLMRHMEQHDPESNAQPEKLKLKMGRLTRVEPDGSVVTVSPEKSRRRPAENDEMKGEDDVAEEEDDEYELFSEEDYEVIETVDEIEEEEEIDEKPLITSVKPSTTAATSTAASLSNSLAPQIKTVSIKKESDGKEFMSVEVGDGQEFMVVEVIQCEDEEEEEEEDNGDESYAAIGNANITQMPVKGPPTSKSELESCFGFVVDEYVDDPDTKEAIQLMDIIDED